MWKTIFMTCLQGNWYQYKEDLKGLYLTCNKCGYEVFVKIENLIENHITDIQLQVYLSIN